MSVFSVTEYILSFPITTINRLNLRALPYGAKCTNIQYITFSSTQVCPGCSMKRSFKNQHENSGEFKFQIWFQPFYLTRVIEFIKMNVRCQFC